MNATRLLRRRVGRVIETHQQATNNLEKPMKITVTDFLSIRFAEIELAKGINVLAGKNGAGKSQLFLGVVSTAQNGENSLRQYGYGNRSQCGGSVIVEPPPRRPLWRPPVRPLAQDNREADFASLGSLESIINPERMAGYTHGLEARFSQLHNRVCNIFVAGSITSAPLEAMKRWTTLTDSFRNVFGKELVGEYTTKGGRVGIRLENGSLTRFATMSTGELEFLCLMCDVIDDSEVDLLLIDEIDAHFHPDLQRRVIDEIKPYCSNRYVLLSSQSPSVMLSVPSSQLFFLRHRSEVPTGVNQVSRLDSDYRLLSSLAEMYAGFSSDLRLVHTFSQAANHDILKYAEECLAESDVVPHVKARDDEPQVAALRNTLLHLPTGATICEVGVGQGRLLRAYEKLAPQYRSTLDFVATDLQPANLQAVQQLADSLNLGFKSLQTRHVSEELPHADLFVLANVVHEVGPDRLADFFTRILKHTKSQGRVLLLEALELAVGERRFVVFDDQALTAMLKRLIDVQRVEVRNANPTSYNGTPLIEVILIVNEPEHCDVADSDVLRALETVQIQAAARLDPYLDHLNNEKSRVLAFHAHNLANAKTFEMRLRSRMESR